MCPPRPTSTQMELFHPVQHGGLPVTPPWQNLPRRTRHQATSLLARLFLDHDRIRTDSADEPTVLERHRGEERDDV